MSCWDDDKTYVIYDSEGGVVSERFYACSEEDALRIAKYVYPQATSAKLWKPK